MRWFVTGTDTEVGKSVVTACLAQALRARGSVVAAKPIASGVAPGTPGEDAALLADAAGHPPCCAVSMVPPVSPHRALLDAHQQVDPDWLQAWIADRQADFVLVEGVGGWRVPVQVGDRPVVVRDLARWTDGPVVVVARDRLGVLNHTLLTVEAIRADGLAVLGVVLNRVHDDEGPPSNLKDLMLLLDVPVAVMPRIDPWDAPARRSAGEALLNTLTAGAKARATVEGHQAHTTEEAT